MLTHDQALLVKIGSVAGECHLDLLVSRERVILPVIEDPATGNANSLFLHNLPKAALTHAKTDQILVSLEQQRPSQAHPVGKEVTGKCI